MKDINSVTTAVTLANAADLAANIAMGVLGNQVAATFAGQPLTRAGLYELAQVTFQAKVATYQGDR